MPGGAADHQVARLRSEDTGKARHRHAGGGGLAAGPCGRMSSPCRPLLSDHRSGGQCALVPAESTACAPRHNPDCTRRDLRGSLHYRINHLRIKDEWQGRAIAWPACNVKHDSAHIRPSRRNRRPGSAPCLITAHERCVATPGGLSPAWRFPGHAAQVVAALRSRGHCWPRGTQPRAGLFAVAQGDTGAARRCSPCAVPASASAGSATGWHGTGHRSFRLDHPAHHDAARADPARRPPAPCFPRYRRRKGLPAPHRQQRRRTTRRSKSMPAISGPARSSLSSACAPLRCRRMIRDALRSLAFLEAAHPATAAPSSRGPRMRRLPAPRSTTRHRGRHRLRYRPARPRAGQCLRFGTSPPRLPPRRLANGCAWCSCSPTSTSSSPG